MISYRFLVLVALGAAALLVVARPGPPSEAITTSPAPLNTNAATDSGYDEYPDVTTDGAGNWVAVWESTDSLGGTIGIDFDILVSRSTNNGDTWTAPAALNTNAGSDSGDDLVPQVTTDGAGNWVAVWFSNDDLGGTIGTDFDILVSRSVDNGASWTAPAALNTNAASDGGLDGWPQVTTDGAGNWVAVWESDDSLGGTIGIDSDILVSRSVDNGASWTAPAALNTNAATDSGGDENPQVTTDGAGNWVAVWDSTDSLGGTIGTDADILVARSTNNGAAWTAPAALNTNAASDSGFDEWPQVTTDGAGDWVAAWASTDSLGGTIGTDSDILVARSTNNGASWTAPAALNTNAATDSGLDTFPRVTTDGAGDWVAVWASDDSLGGTIGTDDDILVSRSTNNGAVWTAPAALNTNAATDSGDDSFPHATTDGAGNWVTVWHSFDSLGGTIGTDADILYTNCSPLDANCDGVPESGPGSPGFPVPLNTNAATDSGTDEIPQVTTDGAGNWVAVWESNEDLGGTIGIDYDILVSRSTDDGATWTAPAALNTNAATDSGPDYSPQVTTDGAGDWLAVWESSDDLGGTIGTDWDILIARSTNNGLSWTAPAALNTNASSDSGFDGYAQVTTDGAGNWVAVWGSNDSLGGTIGIDFDILVSRSTDSGASWTVPAALNTNAATDSGMDVAPQVTTDGAGNWVAVWDSTDSLGGTIGGDEDILVARSTSNGAAWTAPAALNTNAGSDVGDDFSPQVTTDGAGNWVAVWWSNEDLGGTIGTDYDILVSRSTDNGATWTAPAALNTNAASDVGDDFSPQVTTDGAGNWVAVWYSSDSLGGTIGTDPDSLVAGSTNNGLSWTAPAALNTNAATDSGMDRFPQATTDGAGNWVAVWESTDSLGGTIGTDWDILYTNCSPLDADCDGVPESGPGSGSDIVVTKTDSTDPAAVGSNFTYTIRARNDGPEAARGLAVYDALPNPLDGDGRGNKTFVSASVGLDMDGNGVAEVTGLACAPGFLGAQPNPFPPPATYNSTVACSITPTLTASLPAGASAFVTITVTEAAPAGTTNHNLAQAVLTTLFGEASPTTDPDPTNEADCASVFTTPANVGCEATLAAVDTDGDGIPDVTDNDDDGDGYWDGDETTKGSVVLNAASTPEHCDGVDNDGNTTIDEQPTGADWDTDDDSVKDCLDGDVDTDGDLAVNTSDTDDDDDGSTDARERYMSTDELDDCPSTTAHDAWPYDTNKNKTVNINDLLGFPASYKNSFGSSTGGLMYNRRFDFNANGMIDVTDLLGVGKSFKNSYGTSCVP